MPTVIVTKYDFQTFISLIYSEFWSYLADFRKDYKEKFGATPYVCKVTQWLW